MRDRLQENIEYTVKHIRLEISLCVANSTNCISKNAIDIAHPQRDKCLSRLAFDTQLFYFKVCRHGLVDDKSLIDKINNLRGVSQIHLLYLADLPPIRTTIMIFLWSSRPLQIKMHFLMFRRAITHLSSLSKYGCSI